MRVLNGIQSSLVALLGKMFGKAAATDVKAQGMKGEKAEGKNEKGIPLGDPGGHLLHGVGYGTKDARTHLKNKVEEENVNRFLEAFQDPKDPAAKTKGAEAEHAPEKKEGELERKGEAQERREARDKDVKREEQRDDARMQGRHEAKEQLEQRDHREAHEKEHQRDREERDQDEQKHASGWVLDDADEQEEPPRKGGLATQSEVYNDNARCKGALDDGSRCLRKPVKGIGYCREHAMSWRPDIEHKA